MEALSPKVGASILVTPGGVQQRISIPALGIRTAARGGDSISLSLTSTAIAASVVGAYSTVTAQLFARFRAGDIIDVSGFANAGNNGRKVVTAINAAGNLLTVTGFATMVNEAASPSVTISAVRLPMFVMLVANSGVPTANLWGTAMGAPPAAETGFFVGTAPLILNVGGYDQIIVDGATGLVTVTPLENG